MNRALKAFLRAIAALCLWGAPIIGFVALASGFVPQFSAGRLAVAVGVAGYFIVIALLVGGVLQLLLSIDDRLERLEANR